LAEESGIQPLVEITFRRDNQQLTVARPVGGNRDDELSAVAAGLTVDPIIRGHALRAFVEEETAEKRYEQVAGWLQLAPLVEVQRNLRSLRSQLKAAAEDTSELRRIDGELRRATSGSLDAWCDDQVLDYLNGSVLAPLDRELAVLALSTDDPTIAEVRERVKEEEKQVGLSTCKQGLQSLERIYATTKSDDDAEDQHSGSVVDLASAFKAFEIAERDESDERASAAKSVFSAVWEAAEPLFSDDTTAPEECPVCTTPIEDTRAGSVDAIRLHLRASREGLAAYASAKRALDRAEQALGNKRQMLITQLQNIPAWLTDSNAALKLAAETLSTDLTAERKNIPAVDDFIQAVTASIVHLDEAIAEIEQRQGEHTYGKAIKTIDDLVRLSSERNTAEDNAAELNRLHEQLVEQTTYVSGQIREHVQELLDELRRDMNELYSLIQGDSAVPVRLELPHEDDTNQQRLYLLIDFAPNRVGVQPSGYLSDSQIHSLALAFRLAAINRFNGEVPLVVLDDIVTSYDADHRRLIASMLAQRFADHQVIVTTHDERFFVYLKDQLSAAQWRFLRIISINPEAGPKFADHKVSDELIQSRWDQGESAANEMRQAEEEWLLDKCREFGAKVQIRSPERAHSYERSELAEGLESFLREVGLTPPLVPGINNRFLTSLQQGAVENFGSHFQDALYGGGSQGDEQARWREFVAFRDLFRCSACTRSKFKRPAQLRRPICAHRPCETQFAFPSPAQDR
jgi:DNA repair exonuclease SbcCD ATPase subunit